MNDKELLQLAAKAAGYEILYWEQDCPRIQIPELGLPIPWNPLKSGADAFYLMVQLGIPVKFHKHDIEVKAFGITLFVQHGGRMLECDILSATRRAIVRAAAEIAKQEGQPPSATPDPSTSQ